MSSILVVGGITLFAVVCVLILILVIRKKNVETIDAVCPECKTEKEFKVVNKRFGYVIGSSFVGFNSDFTFCDKCKNRFFTLEQQAGFNINKEEVKDRLIADFNEVIKKPC